MTRFFRLAALATLALPLATPGLAEEAVPEPWPLRIHAGEASHAFRVEVADAPAERSRGLMGREQLAEGAGMLFLYATEQPGGSGFWMYNTLIPLDIAFIDGAGRIVSTHTMVPCGSNAPGDCPVTRPGVPYRAALEVPAGTFASLGVEVGDCVAWPGVASRCESPSPG
ncbi:hypothetical protein SAMN04487957_101200 [Halomonas shengliensis]|uniref:DUF192 domain-containing protein n=1 Tax=Halomonas shengliensis TaxID=419597 RepID=A0A1H0CYM5_9GAMM|nr:DUF192 domain-containing protein [Halomonas shengliensis]SDN63002.1 hypothetical protein SAMN04487957_101200 [Halomonas shengliensis]